MLLEKIKTHNYLNGLMFSAVEFFLAAVIVAPFFIYYLTHDRLVYAAVAGGLISNFLTIVFFALLSLSKKEESLGLSFYLDREKRKKVAQAYPNLGRDTLMLCIGFLVPFCLFIVATYEATIKRIG